MNLIYDNFSLDSVGILCYDLVISISLERWDVRMKNTYARPVRDLRNSYNEIIELANAGNQVIITQNGREAAVVLGTQAYREYETFLYRQYINRGLVKAKKKAKDPSTEWISEDEYWADFEE